MISAKDEFFLEREMILEMENLMDCAGLDHWSREKVREEISGPITAEEYKAIALDLIGRNMSALAKVKNGMTLNAKDINKAVKQAANNE